MDDRTARAKTDVEAFRELKKQLSGFARSRFDQEVKLAHAWNFARDHFTKQLTNTPQVSAILTEIKEILDKDCRCENCHEAKNLVQTRIDNILNGDREQ